MESSVLAVIAVIVGLALLVWSADRFVDGASATARHLGMSPLLIGMVIMGFGTSAPEMLVSATAALNANSDLALGNAYGSNIANITLILGTTALISPIIVRSDIMRKELPLLSLITIVAGLQLYDGTITRFEALSLAVLFFTLMGWQIFQARKARALDTLEGEVSKHIDDSNLPLKQALLLIAVGLTVLIASSHILVWGAVEIATELQISKLIIGLTVVSVGTSLPELAASIAAARKNEHEIALGNVIGSNMFNTLAVVAIAGGIHPITVGPEVFYRDWVFLICLTCMLFVMCYGFKKPGNINRTEGGILLMCFILYTGYLITQALSSGQTQ